MLVQIKNNEITAIAVMKYRKSGMKYYGFTAT